MATAMLIFLGGVLIGATVVLPLAVGAHIQDEQTRPGRRGSHSGMHDTMDEMMGAGTSDRMHARMPDEMQDMHEEMMDPMEGIEMPSMGMMGGPGMG